MMQLGSIYRALLMEAVGATDIIKSINNNYLVELTYRDEKNMITKRVIEPYVYGVDHRGYTFIRAWHKEGQSISAHNGKIKKDRLQEAPGWRLFRMNRIISYVLKKQKFDISADYISLHRPKYKGKADKQMSNVLAYVKPKTIKPSGNNNPNTPGSLVNLKPKTTEPGKLGGLVDLVRNDYNQAKNNPN